MRDWNAEVEIEKMDEVIDTETRALLISIYRWCNTIRLSTREDGTDDTALIIQELIERYIFDISRALK